MVLRYSGVFALVPGLFFTSLQNRHCQVAASLGEAGVVLVTSSAGVIFSYRVFAIWRYNKIVIAVIAILYLFMVGCWVRCQNTSTTWPLICFNRSQLVHSSVQARVLLRLLGLIAFCIQFQIGPPSPSRHRLYLTVSSYSLQSSSFGTMRPRLLRLVTRFCGTTFSTLSLFLLPTSLCWS